MVERFSESLKQFAGLTPVEEYEREVGVMRITEQKDA
jgi:hypothetical protein